MLIYTTLLDQTDHEAIALEMVTNIFSRLRQKDLEETNGGYFEYLMDQGTAIILFFIIRTPDEISFRYDYNVPDARHGTAWYSVTDTHDRTTTDAGDEQYVPVVSFVDMPAALEIITQFFLRPEEKPAHVSWMPADFFEWPY
ncbi:hypothetical protein HHL17_27960 [Chitinophaga sp. G-6-1-13]|uniref:Immunity protein Imm1 n=1 Tax=Chitinophaga fulva TaxID=2728842 RepID=A0A848GUA7_9BACT|nr:hypothetical protein [Chitinophaga fulva]NML41061.1 hypothetical protein [Chitinophaga fulva]